MTTPPSDQPRFAIQKSTLLHLLGHANAALRLDMQITKGHGQAKRAGLAVTPAKDCEARIKLCESLIEAVERGEGLLIIQNAPDSEQSKPGKSTSQITVSAGDAL